MPKPKEKEENNENDEKSKRTKGESFEREKKENSEAKMNKDVLLAPPFPMALQSRKVINNAPEIFEVLKQVKVNIPLLDMIRQVPTYAKFLKDLCTIKRDAFEKESFLD
ncbi:hypothetical protein AAG906_019230 [Vitis piasezkii]